VRILSFLVNTAHLTNIPGEALSYPSVCLLIAAMHVHTVGHDVITFEMLYDAFREQFRASSAAPIQIEGGSIGMAKCTREVLMSVCSVVFAIVLCSLAFLHLSISGLRATFGGTYVHPCCCPFIEHCSRICSLPLFGGKGRREAGCGYDGADQS
jgi:hypothetical protein